MAAGRYEPTLMESPRKVCRAPACCAQVALFISVLFTLRWPLSIMENVNGLLSGGCT